MAIYQPSIPLQSLVSPLNARHDFDNPTTRGLAATENSEADDKGAICEVTRVPMEMVWEEVNVAVRDPENKENPKKVLVDVSGRVKTGEFLAIMGATESGKTTLLTYLSGKMLSYDLVFDGDKFINGKSTKISKWYKRLLAYVEPEDIFLDFLTVEECFDYAARFKFSSNALARYQKVQELLAEYELTDVRNVLTGGESELGRRLTDGERKRLSIAIETMNGPSLVFLDEPTMGLSFHEGEKVIEILNKLRLKGTGVVITMKQPTTFMYNTFDQLMILALGRVIYHGTRKSAIEYFDSIDFTCPTDKNPADFFLSVVSLARFAHLPDHEEEEEEKKEGEEEELDEEAKKKKEEEKKQKEKDKKDPKKKKPSPREKAHAEFIEELAEKFDEKPKFYYSRYNSEFPDITKELLNAKIYHANFFSQFLILLHRTLRLCLRRILYDVISLITFALIGALLIPYFYKVGTETEEDFMRRATVIYLMLCLTVMGGLIHYTQKFPEERAVLVREQASSFYDIPPYFFAKVIGELPFSLLHPVVLLASLYWTVPFARSTKAFFLQMAAMSFAYQTGAAYGYFMAAFVDDHIILFHSLYVICFIFILISGFFVDMEDAFSPSGSSQWVSTIRYAFDMMVHTEFDYNDNIEYFPDPEEDDAVDFLTKIGVTMEFGDALLSMGLIYGAILILALLGFIFTTRRI